jgi:putative sensor protein
VSRFLAPLVERRTYLETADLLLDLAVGVVWFSVFTTLVSTGVGLLITIVGFPILTATFHLARIAAAGERARARVFLDTKIEKPVRAPAHGEGLLQKLVTPFRDQMTWKELFYVWLVQPILSVVNFSAAVIAWSTPLWLLTLPIYAWRWAPELWSGRDVDSWGEIIPFTILGLVLLPLALWIVRAFAALDRALARRGLRPIPTTQDRVETAAATQS